MSLARLILLGGETLNGLRYVSWNFVASSKEKLEAAKEAGLKVTLNMAASSFPLTTMRNLFLSQACRTSKRRVRPR